MHCGRRLEALIKKSGLSKKEFAARINTPPQTLSGWFKWDDIPLANIRRCCDILNIKLWEFFVENDAELQDYVPSWITPGQIEFLKAFNSLPKKQQEKLLKAFIEITASCLD
jgi:transcriptional regulator with XRE-family HTH domain